MKAIKFFLFISIFLALSGLIIYFSLFYFLRERGIVQVPDITGFEFRQAQQLLASSGLKLIKVKELTNEKVPAGVVLSQRPPAGIRIKRGEKIEVILSKGPRMVVVPRIEKMDVSHARVTLHKVGLNVGHISFVYDDTVPKNFVIQQYIKAGASVPKQSAINFLVSAGPIPEKIIIPDFQGLNREVVDSFVRQGKFAYVVFNRVKSPIYPANSVIKQSPAPFTFVTKDATLKFWIASEPDNAEYRDYKIGLLNYVVSPGLLFRDLNITMVDRLRHRELFKGKEEPLQVFRRIVIFKSPAKIEIFENNRIKDVIVWN